MTELVIIILIRNTCGTEKRFSMEYKRIAIFKGIIIKNLVKGLIKSIIAIGNVGNLNNM